MSCNYQKIVILTLILLSGSISDSVAGGGCADFSITRFSQIWCQTAPYPTANATVSFAITEDINKTFKKNQIGKTLIVDLPAGFEFDQTSVTATVANSVAGDISACSFAYLSASQIELTITTVNATNFIDSILFDNFEIYATSPGTSGDVLRTAGDFQIDGSTDCPGDGTPETPESLGYLFADNPMQYDSSRVIQVTTEPIRKTCSNPQPILEIKVSVTNTCPTAITQFNLNTNGDVGFSQNPLINITSARIFYSGTTQGFSSDILFGTVASPNGVFVITGSQLLSSSSDHYFYLAYEVPGTAITGEGLDAQLDSFMFDGSFITDMLTPNPTGIRIITDSICLQPDLPNPAANLQLVKSGSLIIPMDTANQSVIAPFNLGAYGLVHNLLLNDVPVRWIIRSGKARNDTDFSALAERQWPTVVPTALTEFRASAFVIDSQWVNTPYSQWVQSATQVINSFGNSVAVFELKEDKMLDVRYEMNQRPKIAVFDNGGNDPIHVAILTAAGLTPIDTANPLAGGSYITVGAGVFTGIDECYTFCSEPHWAGTLADSSITDNIRRFIYDGGNFLAQCKGVDTYENFSQINIVSTDGISIVNQTVTHLYSNPDLAIMQFEGGLVENEGGSERNWVRAPGSTWRSGTYYAISDTDIDTIVLSGSHLVEPDSVGGNVFYLGGHDYSPFMTLESLNAARIYLNASLIPSGRPTLFTLDPGDTLFSCVGYPVTLGGSPTGPADATYQWSPGTWLDDSTAQNPVATPLDSITYSVLAYRGGCIVGPFTIQINASPVPVPDAGPDQEVCRNLSPITLAGSMVDATGGTWVTLGSGTFANDSVLTTTYTPGSADTSAGFVDIILIATGGCDSIQDTMQITFTPSPSVNAGPDQTICITSPDATMAGTVVIATGGVWTTSGTGTFDFDTSLTAIYSASDVDTAAGSVTLTLTSTGNGACPAVSDDVVITFGLGVYIDAGADQTVCANNSMINLNGLVTGASASGVWTTTGTGTFANDTILTTFYTPSIADTSAGFVTLILTSTNNGNCEPDADSMVINFIMGIYVSANVSQAVCANNPTVTLAGSVWGGTATGEWSTSGTGVFVPDVFTLNSTYNPSPADIALGFVILTLTSTGNGICLAVTDTMVVTITGPPTANAGNDTIICANINSISLNGSVTIATGGTWISSGTGTFTPGPTTLNATYTFSVADTAAGTVNLILTTTGNGGCNAVADAMTVTITDAPNVDAGIDQTVCANNSAVSLAGTVTIATGGIWSGGTGTYSPGASSLITTYNPSGTEITAGTVTLVLTSTGNGGCNPEVDSITITIVPSPLVDAGNDTVVCSNNADILLAGSVTLATGGVWTTSGTGTFNDSSLLNAVYTVSSADSAAGTITLTLTSTGNGSCLEESDDLVISFFAGIFVDAGPDQIVCLIDSMAILAGLVSGGTTTGQWINNTGGTFTPGNTTLNASYNFSPTDIANGTVTLYLTSTGNGLCSVVIDSLVIIITPGVNAGNDIIVCNNVDTIQLNGSVENVLGGVWITNGSGTFTPNDSTLNAYYNITQDDIDSGGVYFILTTIDSGLCPSGTDTVFLTIIPPSTATALSDQTICLDSSGAVISGSFTYAGGIIWTTTGGGSFLPAADSLNAIYIPDTVGFDTLTLTTTGSCNNATDFIIITITPEPTVDAGPDISTCISTPDVALSGSFTIATGAIWSTIGSGSFTPGNTNMNPTYIASAADTSAGSVTIVLSTTGNGICKVHTDTMVITYTPNLITVDAGPDTTVCNNTPGISLFGVISIATGGTWTSSGTGTFSPSADSLTTSYIPSGSDTVLGSVTLYLSTTGNGGCNALIDSLTIGFLAAPLINAGNDTTVCYTEDSINLFGSITNSGGAIWTTSGTGSFTPDSADLNAAYLPTPADIIAGGITLTLTNYQSCNIISDTIRIDIVPTVDAEPDTVVCNDVDTIQLNGIVTGAVGGIWATSGTGIFFPNDTTLNGIYVISAADSAAGGVIITLTSTGNLSGCPPLTDIMTVTILPPPTISAGPDQIKCANEDSVFLSGTVTNAGGVWTSNGTGSFYPDSVTLNAVYLISDADTASGLITLTFTTTGSCMLLMDSMQISITPPPTANFTNTEACLNSITYFTDQSSGTIISWYWDFGNGNTDSVQNPQYVLGSSGVNNVTLVVTALNGCIDTITKPVLVNPAPVADFTFDSVCKVDTVYFLNNSTAISPDSIVSYFWEFGDATSSTISNPSHIYSAFGSYLVTLIVESGSGCRDTLQSVVVVSPSPVANFSMDNNIVSTEQTVYFTDLSSGSGSIPDTIDLIFWDWDFYYESSGADSSSDEPNPPFLYGDTGQYIIQLVVTNEFNCTDTIYKDIIVHLEPLVPSGFSPDGNNENDILYVLGGPFSELDFVIYNEWGEVIFTSEKQSDGWDGTKDGVNQPMGVYVYNVIATGIDGKKYHLWGDVTLLR